MNQQAVDPNSSSKEDEDALERKADLARGRLLELVDELDHRRHAVAKPLKPALFLVGGALAVGVGALLVTGLLDKKRKPLRSTFTRAPPSFAQQLAQKLAVTCATLVVSTLGKLALDKTVDALAQREAPRRS